MICDIGINLLRKTFPFVSKRGKKLINNEKLKTFIISNEKNGHYASIEAKALKSFENPYLKDFYETRPEPFRPDCIQRAMSGEFRYYVTENGRLYYKVPKNSTSKKFKIIMKKPFQLVTKARHKKFKRKIAKGKFNSNFINFKPSESVEGAIKFAQDNGLARNIRGINSESQSDLELLNKINEALCNIHNKTGGRSIMPRTIQIKNALKSADGMEAVAAYTDVMDILQVNRNAKISLFTIYHEMGHANHALNTDFLKMSRIDEIIARGGKNAKVTHRFCGDNELKSLIRANMRDYATTSPAEFVADAFAHKIEGHTLSYKLQQAYEALNSPKIIGIG